MAAVRARQVVGDGRVPPPVRRAAMARDPQALVEDLDGVVGDVYVDELADEAEGHGGPVALGLALTVRRHAAALPAGEGTGFGWQRLEASIGAPVKETSPAG